MTVEQKLREALAGARSAIRILTSSRDVMEDIANWNEYARASLSRKIANVDAALALPATPVREEWRVAYQIKYAYSDQWVDDWIIHSCEAHAREGYDTRKISPDFYRNVRIQRRLVPEPGPWKDVEC